MSPQGQRKFIRNSNGRGKNYSLRFWLCPPQNELISTPLFTEGEGRCGNLHFLNVFLQKFLAASLVKFLQAFLFLHTNNLFYTRKCIYFVAINAILSTILLQKHAILMIFTIGCAEKLCPTLRTQKLSRLLQNCSLILLKQGK